MLGRLVIVMSLLALGGCSEPVERSLKISTTNWIGYTPLLYANAKGWLAQHDIELVQVVSLSENMYLFEAGNSDAFVGTQYAYHTQAREFPNLVPVMMFDRSWGGDMVLSNHDLGSLQEAEDIEVFLTLDTINLTVLQSFLGTTTIAPSALRYTNMEPPLIAELQPSIVNEPMLIVTFSPMNIPLLSNGFMQLASTRDSLDLLVVDALYTTRTTLESHEEQFIALKQLIEDARSALQTNPAEFYNSIKPYLRRISFDEFMESLEQIVWMTHEIDDATLQRLQLDQFPTDSLLP